MVPRLTIIIPLEPSSSKEPKGLSILPMELSIECEVILLDWRTSEDTLKFARESFAAHPATRVLTFADDTRAGKVFNESIREAKGDFITFMDPNDEPTPRAVERILGNISQKNTVDLLLLSASVGKLDDECFFLPLYRKNTFNIQAEGSGLKLMEKLGRSNDFLKCELFLGCYKRSFIMEHKLFVGDGLNDLMALEWLPKVFFHAHHCATLTCTLPNWWDFVKPDTQFRESQQDYLDALPHVILSLAKFFSDHQGEMTNAACIAWAETTFHPLLRKVYSHLLPERIYDKKLLQMALAKLWENDENTVLLESLSRHLSFTKRFFLALMRRFAKSGSDALPKLWAKLFLRYRPLHTCENHR
ncbi:MAG: glycosyltransferase [Lentisphaeria bacterium]|nr:glycosyltransferase [Lentisphaeria bacterium]